MLKSKSVPKTVLMFNQKKFLDPLDRGSDEMSSLCHSRENGKGDLNNKFRFLIFRLKDIPNLIGYETSEILLWLCLGDSWFQEIFINLSNLSTYE